MGIRIYTKERKFWAGILLAQFILFYLFSKIPWVVSFFESLFELKKNIHVRLFSWLFFSVGDIFYIFLVITILNFLIKICKKRTITLAAVRLLMLTNVFYFVYQISWGMLYFQSPLIEKLSKKDPTMEERKVLTIKYLEKCKQTRMLIKEDKNGVFKIWQMEELKSEILKRQKLLPTYINAKEVVNTASIKASFYRKLMNYSGILGYYNPFTTEAQYNSNLPSSLIPFTLAHESAHQIGYAREQEASFIGYLIGKNSKNLELRYSTEFSVLKSLLNSLAEENPEFVKWALQNYSSGMKRDRMYEKTFAKKYGGPTDDFFFYMNNLFLKSNQQEGSITYSYFIDLLVRYERKNTK